MRNNHFRSLWNFMQLTISNILTIIRFILVPVFLILFFSSSPTLKILATLVFIIGAITDHYDGKLARRRREITEFGKFSDPLADKFLAISAFIAIFLREDFGSLSTLVLIYIILIAVREFGITILRMWAVSRSTPVITSIWGKLKTTFQLIAIIFALVCFNVREILPSLGLDISLLQDEYLLPIIHFLIFLSMVFTVVSGALYLTPSSLEKSLTKN